MNLRRSTLRSLAVALLGLAGAAAQRNSQSPATFAGNWPSSVQTPAGTVAASPDPNGFGRSFILAATITPPAPGALPSGSVGFSIDGAALGAPVPLAGGTASFTVGSPIYAVGIHTITAVYSGDANYNPVTLTGSFTVTLLPSQTYMTDIVTPIHYGEIIGDIAKGYALPQDPTDSTLLDGGNLDFLIDGQVVCTLPVISGLSQTCPATTGAGYSAGTYTLGAAYRGNQFYTASASPGYPVQVLPDDTTATLFSSGTPAFINTPVKLSATFNSPFATPAGTVTFFEAGVRIATATLDASGTASFTTSTLTLGTHPITATLASSQNFNGSTTAVLQQLIVQPAVATSTQLTSSLNPSTVGQSVTFTARILASITPSPTPTGTVTFTADGTALGTFPLDPTGAASVTLSTLAVGSHIVVATYSGFVSTTSTTFSPGATTLIQRVNPLPGFTLTVDPTSIPVPIGNYASTLVTITSVNGFNAPVALACADLPRAVTCTFDTPTIANPTGTTHLRIFATAPHDCENSSPYFVTPAGPITLFGTLASTSLILLLRRRRKLLAALTLSAAMALFPTITGCSHCTDLGVFPGPYTFTVTATSGPITASQTVHITAHL